MTNITLKEIIKAHEETDNIDGIYCRDCGEDITTGYSICGYCVVCAAGYVNNYRSNRNDP